MALEFPTLAQANIANKTVLVRVDFNLPLSPQGEVLDDLRLQAHVPTIDYLLKQNAKVVLLSHLGRPRGRVVPELSLKPLADYLKRQFETEVKFVPDCVGRMAEQDISEVAPGQIVLLENVRFHAEELSNDPQFARNLSKLADVYVNDAFATSHRPHASILGITDYLPAYAGKLLESEVSRVLNLLEEPKRPLVAVIGGAKLARKVDMLRKVIFHADQVMVGGTIANTMLAAKDIDVGRSIVEPDYIEVMRDLLVEAGIMGCRILLPQDVVTAKMLQEGQPPVTKNIENLAMDDMILDIGPNTIDVWSRVLQKAGTIVWNGPVGSYETKPFDEGSGNLANAIVHSDAASIAAGRDTLLALRQYKLREEFDALSTATNAFIDLISGRELHGLQALVGRKIAPKK